jgi:hypothetical protein
MRGDILARIPADNGKKIHWGAGVKPMVVALEPCEDCGAPGQFVIQGETDSFGFEPCILCQVCVNKGQEVVDTYDEALDVEDREGSFLVDTVSNIDRYEWCRAFSSYRAAVAFFRHIEKLAEPYAGLYPRNSRVQERADAFEVVSKWRRLMAEELSK